jgi:hypothetical protein
MNIKIANTLFDDGTFSAMYKAGFITDKVFLYREIYLWIQAQLQTRRITKSQAAKEAVSKFDKDERTVWRALNSFSPTDKTVSVLL